MNANELADVLETNPILNPFFTKEAVAMLRQRHIKELTDGEIERIYFQTESVWDKDGNFEYLEFARAILRKAQKK